MLSFFQRVRLPRSPRPVVRLVAAASLIVAGSAVALAAPSLTASPASASVSADCTITVPPTVGGVVRVTTPGQLAWIANTTVSLSATIEQMNDLDLAGCGNWPGIGTSSDEFQGTYDGNGHTISNVSSSAPSDYWGLFRYLLNASISALTLNGVTVSANNKDYLASLAGEAVDSTIENVTVIGASITTGSYSGGLVGYFEGGSIIDSSVSGELTATGDYLGGLAGQNYGGSIIRSSAAVDVTAGSNYIGGLVGENSGPITDTYATGDVIGFGHVGGLVGYNSDWYAVATILRSHAHGNVSGPDRAGGLVGRNIQSSIALSFATGDVTNSGNATGGLVGENSGPISDSYATGNVNGDTNVGGLAGLHGNDYGDGNIDRSYATGVVTGSADVGGLVGYIDTSSNPTSTTGSLWDVESSGTLASAGGSGSTSAQMQSFSTFDDEGWSITNGDSDLTKAWGLCEGRTYPFLMWQTQLPRTEPGFATCTIGGGDGDDDRGPSGGNALPPGLEALVAQAVPTTTAVPGSSTTTTPTTTVAPADTPPSPVLIDGALPSLANGEATVLEGGTPVATEVIVEDGNQLVIRDTTFALRLRPNCATGGCGVTTTADGRPVLTLDQNSTTTVTGTGFSPGSTVHMWLFSKPTYLGRIIVDSDGSFQGSIDVGTIEPGRHTLQLNGTTNRGTERSANLGVVVNQPQVPTPGPGVLPSTGTDTTPIWLIALTLLGLGLLATRRRRRPA